MLTDSEPTAADEKRVITDSTRALGELARCYSDLLGAINDALKAGAINRDQWEKLLFANTDLQNRIEEVLGVKNLHAITADYINVRIDKAVYADELEADDADG